MLGGTPAFYKLAGFIAPCCKTLNLVFAPPGAALAAKGYDFGAALPVDHAFIPTKSEKNTS